MPRDTFFLLLRHILSKKDGIVFKINSGGYLMCGIAGQIGKVTEIAAREQAGVYRQMLESLRRRGPDQYGIFTKDCAALIHTRLAIVDLDGGCQPMLLSHADREFVLVYNGELYNTAQLRAELTEAGHSFEGYSDTEVVVHAYAEWGEACLDRFNGIYAFAVWETRARRLFLARDRMGVKPLFYAEKCGSLLFASELKALLCHPLIEPVIDDTGLAELICLGPGRTPGCGVFKDVCELEPGCCAFFDAASSRLTVKRYWALEDRECTDSFEQAAERVRALVSDAVTRQLVSDVQVCTFLSGGLDSSIISALAARHYAEQGAVLDTETVDYRDNAAYFQQSRFQPNSDADFVPVMTEFLSSRQHLTVIDTGELVPALYEAVIARDLPGMADVDASLLLFCREIKKHATVALSGECADEIFGGYPWFRDKTIRDREGFPWAQSNGRRESMLHPEFTRRINCDGYVQERYRKTLAETSVLPGRNPDETRLRQMVNLNFRWFMQTLLDRKDRMSMYSGLEVRVPFCDHRIAEYLYTLPWEYKDYGGTEKGLLREAMHGLLPEEILRRRKSPYPKTHHPSYTAAVSKQLCRILEDSSAPIHRFIRRKALEGLLQHNTAVPWYGQLMTGPQTIAYMLQFNFWLTYYKVDYRP